jgi:hypothetical protein
MKQFYISSILILLTCSSYSQESKETKKETTKKMPTLEAIYDFEKQTYITDELKPVHKQPVILKIININKIANNVEIISSDVKINDDFLDAKEEQVKSIIEDTQPVEEIKPNIVNVDLDVNVPQETKGVSNPEINKKIKKLRNKIIESNNTISELNNAVKEKLMEVKGIVKQKLEIKIKLENDVMGLEDEVKKRELNTSYTQQDNALNTRKTKLEGEINTAKTSIR